ncbi:hypothetical protein [Dokdonella ginsengisoli]|uniref:Uncharacterized protein n=1 Tax=Dokdonella ginsengisoli TaxID=363846 RepID=A0ABV9QYY0_9GAMM
MRDDPRPLPRRRREGVVAIDANARRASSSIEIRRRGDRSDLRFCASDEAAKARSVRADFPASAIARRSAGKIFFFRLFAVAEPPAPPP